MVDSEGGRFALVSQQGEWLILFSLDEEKPRDLFAGRPEDYKMLHEKEKRRHGSEA